MGNCHVSTKVDATFVNLRKSNAILATKTQTLFPHWRHYSFPAPFSQNRFEFINPNPYCDSHTLSLEVFKFCTTLLQKSPYLNSSFSLHVFSLKIRRFLEEEEDKEDVLFAYVFGSERAIGDGVVRRASAAQAQEVSLHCH